MTAVDLELPLSLLAPALPPLRLLPVPPCEPPYDDELPDRPAPVQARHQPLRLVPALPPALPVDDAPEDAPARTRSPELPPARPFAHALVQRTLEVLAG